MDIENSHLFIGEVKETNSIVSFCDLMEPYEAKRYSNSFGQLENLKTVEDLLSEIRDRIDSANEQIESIREEEDQINIIESKDFYEEFTKSASKFISPEVQERFRSSNILIAGAGSIGNPIAMMAIRSGAENITIADPDVVEDGNLARQEYLRDQVGQNKADMTVKNMRNINPYATDMIKSVSDGITKENVEELVKNSDIIVDGIDIRATDMTWELHKYASKYKKPVIVGYDMAGTAMLAVYRYDKKNMKILNGDLKENTVEEFSRVKEAYKNGRIQESEFLNYIYAVLTGPINPLNVPVEQFEELISRNLDDTRTYQVGTTSRLISALTIETIKQIHSDKEVKKIIALDLPSSVRKYNPNILTRAGLMIRALKAVKKRGKVVKNMLNNLN